MRRVNQASIVTAVWVRRQRRARLRQPRSLAARRYDQRVTRRALLPPRMSAFQYLFGSGCDQSLVTLTGFDHASFRRLLSSFKPLYDAFTPYSRNGLIKRKPAHVDSGRPRSMDAVQCLALVLVWTRTRGSQMPLTIMVGVTSSVASLFIRFARRLLIKSLANEADARVQLPSASQVREFSQVITAKYPLLKNVYAMMDGLKLRLQSTDAYTVQNMFYNGWTHDHYVTNVLAFAPNGKIIASSLNAPGCLHDSVVTDYGGIYEKLQNLYDETGGRVVVDSAFLTGTFSFLVKCGTLEDIGDQATKLRQSAEWGMRAVQTSFPRLKDRIDYEEMGERKLILLSCVLLFNFRSSTVGMNQILSTFYWDALAKDPMTIVVTI